MKCLMIFIGGALFLGSAGLALGYLVLGSEAVVQGGAAFGLAFVPAAITLAWVLYSYRAAPDMRLLASLGGSGFRMAIALGGGYLLTNARPQLFDLSFWYWLVLFYLALLGFEIALLVQQEPASGGR